MTLLLFTTDSAPTRKPLTESFRAMSIIVAEPYRAWPLEATWLYLNCRVDLALRKTGIISMKTKLIITYHQLPE